MEDLAIMAPKQTIKLWFYSISSEAFLLIVS
jgi:hypothetical protein